MNKFTTMINWQPNNLSVIKERSDLLFKIREFFKQEKVFEVDTPLLCNYAGTAIHLDPFVCKDPKNNLNYLTDNVLNEKSNDNLKFLQTSPEYAMKRLLAAGSPDIFQICKAFRANEIGKLHNPEFTMLEWYRLGFNHHQLMENVGNLLLFVLQTSEINYTIYKKSYKELFIKYVNCDPIIANLNELKRLVTNNIDVYNNFLDNLSKQDCQELLFNHLVEPNLKGDNKIWFVYDYPKEQAALAKIITDHHQHQLAERFEVYVNGIELANGYHELLDVNLQKERFKEEQLVRKKLGKLDIPIDEYFIAALEHGLPLCSGVALGIDRLLMLKINAKSLKEVILFPWEIA